eukprot:g5854.t1
MRFSFGWNDISLRNPNVSTPHMDAMAREGILLDRHYVFKFCSPTRSSILSGRLPIHVNQENSATEQPHAGVMLNFTMWSEKLKAAGYALAQVGKWHAGQASTAHVPHGRGFDTSLGYFNFGEDHYTQLRGGEARRRLAASWGSPTRPSAPSAWDVYGGYACGADAGDKVGFVGGNQTVATCEAACEAVNADADAGADGGAGGGQRCVMWQLKSDTASAVHWCALYNASTSVPKPSPSYTCGCAGACPKPDPGLCPQAVDLWRTDRAADAFNGTYGGFTYAAEAVRVIEAHAAAHGNGGGNGGNDGRGAAAPYTPLAMYIAWQECHGPLQVPDGWDGGCVGFNTSDPTGAMRHTLCGMSSFMDAAMGNLTAALKSTGLWDNTLIVFTAE